MGVVFFLSPVLVSSLGAILFGIWQVINQMNSYMTAVDLRSGTSMKWYIAKYRTTLEEIELRRGTTAGILSNIMFLPVYLFVGFVLVWLAPSITQVKPEYINEVRLTTGLLIIALIIDQYSFLFQSILVGMNLTYKNVGVRIALTISGGLATVLLVYAGYGLPAMATVIIGVAVLSGIINFWILKRCVQWFGFARVHFKEIRSFFGLTARFMALKLVTLLNESTDLMLLGFFAGPKYVTSYVVTRYMVQASSLVVKTVQSSIVPGLGRFFGEGNYEKLVEARKLLITFIWFSVTCIGCGIVLWNRAFIGIWISSNLFAGTMECLLIVLIACFNLLRGIDGSIIIMSLDIRKQIITTGIIAMLTIALASALIPLYQILGLLVAMLTGEIAMNISYSALSQKVVGKNNFIRDLFISRKAVVGILLLGLASYASAYVKVYSWVSLCFSAIITGAVLMFLTWTISMSRDEKDMLLFNLKRINYLNIKGD
jgi:O-antigen/teichoic acid export membrane protein